jgi:protocatechuate 3,4-dioxygenase beta subunit
LILLSGGYDPRRHASAQSQSSCIVRPEQTEGPYFVDEGLHRSDIRSDSSNGTITPGIPLALTLTVSRFHAQDCGPLPGAQVDIWHCDAMGIYSDVRDPGFTTLGRNFLRGYQLTDDNGEVRFLTIYPGWYEGRTVHIHFKVRTAPMPGRRFQFTSQLYFDDTFTDRVYRNMPYAGRALRRTRNEEDRIYRRGGDRLMLTPAVTSDGYAAGFAVTLQTA